MKPGGIADLDVEFWFRERIPQLRQMSLEGLYIASGASGFSGSVEDFLEHLREMKEKGEEFEFSRECHLSKFVMIKPVSEELCEKVD